MKGCRVFVIVPALDMTGPVKGAVALCNGLVHDIPVTLVCLKRSGSVGLEINPLVKLEFLAHYGNAFSRFLAYRNILKRAGSPNEVFSLSYCFSADLLNFFCAPYAKVISSVRGNLPRNYRFDYGLLGLLLAFVHFMLLHRFERVIVMSQSMKAQLGKYGLRRLDVISNFLDEENLESQRKVTKKTLQSFRFVFLGSLSLRKRPELAVEVIAQLLSLGFDCYLDIIGDGPTRPMLEQKVLDFKISSRVIFHGQIRVPYQILQQADWLLHPSESEGLSRSVLEALCLGIPCFIRDVDDNASLIVSDNVGFLFSKDNELFDLVLHALRSPSCHRQWGIPSNLLPAEYRQVLNIGRICELFP